MSKTFTYTVQTGPDIYSEQTDECFCDEADFDYEVSSSKISQALPEIVLDNYFNKFFKNFPDKENKDLQKQLKREFIEAMSNLLSDIDGEDLEDYFEEDLKSYFEEEAMDSYRD